MQGDRTFGNPRGPAGVLEEGGIIGADPCGWTPFRFVFSQEVLEPDIPALQRSNWGLQLSSSRCGYAAWEGRKSIPESSDDHGSDIRFWLGNFQALVKLVPAEQHFHSGIVHLVLDFGWCEQWVDRHDHCADFQDAEESYDEL